MFDLSWGEILIIGLIGILVIGPKELPTVIRTVKSTLTKLRTIWSDLTDSVKEVTDDLADSIEPELKQITDLEGNLQEVYDLSDVMPQPPTSKKNTKHE